LNADFTVNKYGNLLKALRRQGFCFQTVNGFVTDPLGKVVVMRHDVDRLPRNALVMARLEHELHIPATYYFRAVSESWNEGVIREIAGLGHEVGYHYECLGTASIAQRRKGEEKRRDDLDDAFGGMNSMNGWLDGKNEWPRFHSTFEIIAAIEAGRFPEKAMMTVHPQRWDDRP